MALVAPLTALLVPYLSGIGIKATDWYRAYLVATDCIMDCVADRVPVYIILSDCISVGIGVMDNGTATMPTSSGLTCGDELMSWMDQAWLTMIPLLISFAFAVAVESSMVRPIAYTLTCTFIVPNIIMRW